MHAILPASPSHMPIPIANPTASQKSDDENDAKAAGGAANTDNYYCQCRVHSGIQY
eukprot:COSAG01_NODE_31316_length_599_cov_24.528000_1_plen_55_part_01